MTSAFPPNTDPLVRWTFLTEDVFRWQHDFMENFDNLVHVIRLWQIDFTLYSVYANNRAYEASRLEEQISNSISMTDNSSSIVNWRSLAMIKFSTFIEMYFISFTSKSDQSDLKKRSRKFTLDKLLSYTLIQFLIQVKFKREECFREEVYPTFKYTHIYIYKYNFRIQKKNT